MTNQEVRAANVNCVGKKTIALDCHSRWCYSYQHFQYETLPNDWWEGFTIAVKHTVRFLIDQS